MCRERTWGWGGSARRVIGLLRNHPSLRLRCCQRLPADCHRRLFSEELPTLEHSGQFVLVFVVAANPL